MKYGDLVHRKSTQVLRNQFLIAEGNGFDTCNFGVPRDAFLDRIARTARPARITPAPGDKEGFLEAYLNSCRATALIQHTFVRHLEKTLNPKENYGIPIEWRQTQRECLQGIIRAYRFGYQRPAFEVTTGVGKSMIFGAVTRSYIDTLTELSRKKGFEYLLTDSEVYIFTSRIALTEQFVRSKVDPAIDAELDGEELEDKPIEMGDILRWVNGALENPAAQIRVLAGRRGSLKSEKAKDSIVTISTYAGLSQDRIEKVFARQKFPLVLCDEAHRVTDRVKMMLDESFLKGGLRCAGSATLVGPQRPIWDIWERITLPNGSSDKPDFLDGTAYHASYQESVYRGEVPPLRYLEMQPRIDLSSANGQSKKQLNQTATDEILSRNINALKSFMRELLLEDHTAIDVTGAKGVLERAWLVFVTRVQLAKDLTEFINEEIQDELIKKRGKPFQAAYVDGEMSQTKYDDTIEAFENGKIEIIFSCEKIGEGVNIKRVNGIASLRPYGFHSEWKLKQEIGRGRINPDAPDDDLLVVDGMFHSQRHQLASVLGILGRHRTISGGLIAGNLARMNAEHRLYALIEAGKTWEEIWYALTTEERRLLPYVAVAKSKHPTQSPQPAQIDKREAKTTIVQTVERTDVALNLSEQGEEYALEYVRLLLRRRFKSNEAFVNFIKSPMLKLFKTNSFQGIGTGADLINRVLGYDKDDAPKTHSGELINRFLEKIGNIYEVPTRPAPPEGAEIEALVFFAAHFGKLPQTGSNLKTNYKQEYCVGQASIKIVGHNFFTQPINATNDVDARGWALIELQKTVEKEMQAHPTQFNSRIANQKFEDDLFSAFNTLCMVMNINPVEFVINQDGSNTCSAVFMTEPPVRSEPVEIHGGVITKQNRSVASKNLWNKLLGIEANDPPPKKIPPQEHNAKSELFTYCQKHHIKRPVFNVAKRIGSWHHRAVRITLKDGPVIESAVHKANSRKEAERLACDDVLKQLGADSQT